jgi:antitoxin component of MazEF toxin-antitoxin module
MMETTRKVQQAGNCLTVTVPVKVIQKLGIKPRDKVAITWNGGSRLLFMSFDIEGKR